MAFVGERAISQPLIGNQLHTFHAAAKVGVKVSGNRRIADVILLGYCRFLAFCIFRITHVTDMKCVTENTNGGEESRDKGVPITEIVFYLTALLPISIFRACLKSERDSLTGKPLRCSENCISFNKHCPFMPSLRCCDCC